MRGLKDWVKWVALRSVVFIFQRIFLINRECKFPVHFTSRVSFPENIHFRGNSETIRQSILLSGNCYIQAMNGIVFGEGTIIAPGVKIISANHDLKDLGRFEEADPIKIGRHCWIGANAVILPGVELGDYTVVGAGAVVSKSFAAYRVLAGNPAAIIGRRCEKCFGRIAENERARTVCRPCRVDVKKG